MDRCFPLLAISECFRPAWERREWSCSPPKINTFLFPSIICYFLCCLTDGCPFKSFSKLTWQQIYFHLVSCRRPPQFFFLLLLSLFILLLLGTGNNKDRIIITITPDWDFIALLTRWFWPIWVGGLARRICQTWNGIKVTGHVGSKKVMQAKPKTCLLLCRLCSLLRCFFVNGRLSICLAAPYRLFPLCWIFYSVGFWLE